MKKNFKFMLVALLAMLSTNSFAQTPMHKLIGNVVYGYDKDEAGAEGTEAKPFTAYVEGIKGSDLTTVSIEQTASFTNDLGDKVYLKVDGFDPSWELENASLGTSNVTDKLTTLTIDFTNWAVGGFDFSTLTALTSLTLIDSEDTPTLTNLANLILPASVETLDIEKLYGVDQVPAMQYKNTKLTTITLPANLTKIEYSAFEISALTAISLPKGVAYVGNYAFNGCESLASVTFDEDAAITWIGAAAFKGTALTSFAIPAKVTEIKANAFEDCAALTTVTFDEALATIGKEAFKGAGITAADLSGTAVTQIMNGTFKNSKLASITLPEALTGIEAEAFENAPLTAIAIPAATKYVGNYAFNGCESLASVTFAEDAAITWIGVAAFKGTAALTAIAVPETVTEIKDNAFEGSALTELSIPKVTTLGTTIFGTFTAAEPNTTLTNVVLGAVDVFGGDFANFTALQSFTWGDTDGSHYVYANAFENCTSLTDFYYPLAEDASVYYTIDPDAFIGCKQYVIIHTSYDYATVCTEPLNAKYDATAPEPEVTTIPKTVKDKTGSMYFQKFNNPSSNITSYTIDPADVAGVYSIYVDEGIAYFQSLKKTGGKYYINPGECVVIKTDSEKEVEIEESAYGYSVLLDQVMCLGDPADPEKDYSITLADFQMGNELYLSNWTVGSYPYPYPDNDTFIYRLTNTDSNGFGFTKFTGTELKGGQFFILSDYDAAAGRLQTVWLDEDGKVEDEATAIKSIENATEDGAIYNLQGVRVQNAKKGLYIQNGKKYVVK